MFAYLKKTISTFLDTCNQKESKELGLANKLMNNGLAYKKGSHILLNRFGLFAKEIGFNNYFELEQLEQKWRDENRLKRCQIIRIYLWILGVFNLLFYLILCYYQIRG